MKIIVFGEVLWDFFGTEKHIGGAPFNFSAQCVGAGAETYLASAIGNDSLGVDTENEFDKYGIRKDFLQKNACNTGKTDVTMVDGSARYAFVDNPAYQSICVSDEDIERMKSLNADCFYFGTVAQAGEKSVESLNKILEKVSFDMVFCDINIRAGMSSITSVENSLKKCNVLKISREDFDYIKQMGVVLSESSDMAICAESLAKKYKNIKIIVVTLDKDGALVYESENGRTTEVPAKKCKVVSTVGAGDAFSAGFVTSFLESKDIKEAMQTGTNFAAEALERQGALPEAK